MSNIEKCRIKISEINLEIPRILILANTIIMVYLSTIKETGTAFLFAASCIFLSIISSIISLMFWRKNYVNTREDKPTEKIANPEMYEFSSIFFFGTGIIFALADRTWLPLFHPGEIAALIILSVIFIVIFIVFLGIKFKPFTEQKS